MERAEAYQDVPVGLKPTIAYEVEKIRRARGEIILSVLQTLQITSTNDNDSLPPPKEYIQRPSPLYIVPDVHGDAAGFIASLRIAGLITGDSLENMELTDLGTATDIIQTGDMVDRGHEVLEVFDIVKKLREKGAKIALTIGNHELTMLEILHSLAATNFSDKIITAAYTAYAFSELSKVEGETAEQRQERHERHYPKEEIAAMLYHWLIIDAGGTLQSVKDRYFHGNSSLKETLMKAHELFLTPHGEYASLVNSFRLYEQVDDVLACHAGIDQKASHVLQDREWANLNQKFQNLLRSRDFKEIKRLFNDFLWYRKALQDKFPPMSEDDARNLKDSRGIAMIVHGHDQAEGKIQTISNVEDIIIYANDIGLSRYYNQPNGNPGGIFVSTTGTVWLLNSALNEPVAFESTTFPTFPSQYDQVTVFHETNIESGWVITEYSETGNVVLKANDSEGKELSRTYTSVEQLMQAIQKGHQVLRDRTTLILEDEEEPKTVPIPRTEGMAVS